MAFEGLLRPWSSAHTLHRDARFALLNKPAGVSCESRPESVLGPPTPLPERLMAHGLGSCRVECGIPERASGVVLVAFDASAAVGAGESVAPGEEAADAGLPAPLERITCVVAVEEWSLPPSGTLSLDARRVRRLAADAEGPAIEYRVLRRNEERVLIELDCRVRPERVIEALRAHSQPIVGDEGATVATRLMLHVSAARGAVRAEAPLPPEFESWLVGHSTLGPEHFAAALAHAGVSRHGLDSGLGAFRLIGDEEGEIAGVCVERYGDHAVLYLSSDAALAREGELADCLMDGGAAGVYVKRRVRVDLRGQDPAALAPPLPVRGRAAPDAFALNQGPLRVQVSLGDGLATGLFLDQRANWARVASAAQGAAFLNLFCYTGAFTLAASAGGAASTTSVDLAGRALSRLSENLELNGWSGPQHRLLKADVPQWRARAQKNPRRYDAIVLDPPSFGTRSRGVLSTRRDNPELALAAFALLAPGGRLLAVSHHRKISGRSLEKQLARAASAAGVEARIEALVGGWDCPTVPGVSPTKSVLAQSSR